MDAQAQQGGPPSSETYTFITQYNDEPSKAKTLRPQAGYINVAFGAPEMRSGIWRIWTARKGEVYIAERSTSSHLKVSLHKTGDWRVAWIEDKSSPLHPVAADAIKEKGRIIKRWERPPAKFDGYTHAFAILTSGDQLTPGSPDRVPKRNMCWLTPPTVDEVGFIVLAYMKPTGKPIELKGYLILAAFMMDIGEVVLVLAAKRRMKPNEVTMFARNRAYLDSKRDELAPVGSLGQWPMRAMLLPDHTGPLRYFLDMRMSRP